MGGEDFLGSTVMRPGLGGIEVGQVLTPVSIHIYLGAGGGVGLRQRPQITALEPRPLNYKLTESGSWFPPSGRSYPPLLLWTVRVKT